MYTNHNGDEIKIVTLSNVIQKHLDLLNDNNIKPGLPYQDIKIFLRHPLSLNMKREEKSPINDNIIKDLNYYNKNEHIEGTNDQEQSNISQNLLFTNSVLSNQSTKLKKLSRRSISNAVIESAHCEHIELIECDSYETNDMKCLITATGMPCCVCTGRLKSLRKVKKWIVW